MPTSPQVGDNLHDSIQRAGFANVQIEVTRSTTPPSTSYVTLMPSTNGSFTEEDVVDEDLDGAYDAKYWIQTLVMEFLQTDADTLADLYSTGFIPQFYRNGINVKMTRMNGDEVVLPMKCRMRLHGEGFGSALAVTLTFKSRTLVPISQ